MSPEAVFLELNARTFPRSRWRPATKKLSVRKNRRYIIRQVAPLQSFKKYKGVQFSFVRLSQILPCGREQHTHCDGRLLNARRQSASADPP
jgi:hypothetical protein